MTTKLASTALSVDGKPVGLVNPYALAELMLGDSIQWNAIPDVGSFLAEQFKTTPEFAFDPTRDPNIERSTLKKIKSSRSKIRAWKDKGSFFSDVTQYSDPIQGAVGNCYLIAALSAVALAMPSAIAHRTKPNSVGSKGFRNIVHLYKKKNKKWKSTDILVSDLVPVNASGRYIYARSLDLDEIWPAIYEKAYSNFRTGKRTSDRPDILVTAKGYHRKALSHITGHDTKYVRTKRMSITKLRKLISDNSRGKKRKISFRPMACDTYPKKGNDRTRTFEDGNIVRSHVYVVVGYTALNKKRHVILRNPWGKYYISHPKPKLTTCFNVRSWSPHRCTDFSSPKRICPDNLDGTFAISIANFKRHFEGVSIVQI